MFWPVVYTSLAVSAATFVVVYGYWRWWPNRRHKRRVKDMAAMRDLLVHHVDDLDDIMDKLQHGTCEFAWWQHAVLLCYTFLLQWASNAVQYLAGHFQGTEQGSAVHQLEVAGSTGQDDYLHCDVLCVCVCQRNLCST